MKHPFADVCCASLPREALPALAELRTAPGVTAALVGERAWVHWEAGDEAALRCILPVTGVHLYHRKEDHWYRWGEHLPSFDFPTAAEYRPLHQLLFPNPVRPTPASRTGVPPVPLVLVRDHRPRDTTAVRCALAELARWADTVPTSRLEDPQAARCDGHVLLRGRRLPLLPSSERYWGNALLIPLGSRPEPDLSERALREALSADPDEILLWGADRVEAIPRSAFGPLTRAGLRLAGQEVG